MCGRINVSDHPGVQQLLDFLDMPYVFEKQSKIDPELSEPRYNISPGSLLLSVFASKQVTTNAYNSAYMSWGILPEWAKPEQFSRPLINARAESIWEKPSFQHLIKSNRAIIPVNGFYEWKRDGNNKRAFHIHSSTEPAMALAGIYQISGDLMQCSIITTEANPSISAVHHRMPVILDPANFPDWLQSNDKETLNSLMTSCPDKRISIDPVSSYVNSTHNQGPGCLKPAEEATKESEAPIEKQLKLF